MRVLQNLKSYFVGFSERCTKGTFRIVFFIFVFFTLFLTWRIQRNAVILIEPGDEETHPHSNMFHLTKSKAVKNFTALNIPIPYSHQQVRPDGDPLGCLIAPSASQRQRPRSEESPPQHLVVGFVGTSHQDLVHMLPLLQEMEHSPLSNYVPAFALLPGNPSVAEIREMVKPEDPLFGCRIFRFPNLGVKYLQLFASQTKAVALISVKGSRGLEASLSELYASFSLPYVLVPPEEFTVMKWLSYVDPVAFQNWKVPQVTISIITANRPQCLQRLLTSLKNAFYLGDQVDIIINTEAFSDEITLSLVALFDWPYGTKIVRHRVKAGGLISAVVESWYPKSLDEYGILLEDDIEVSPLFYVWCRYSLMTYQYGAFRNRESGLFGFSLYTPRKNELKQHLAEERWDSNAFFEENAGHPYIPYLHALPCSWGALFFPKIWMEFHAYVARRINAESNVMVRATKSNGYSASSVMIRNSKSNGWRASWKKFFYEMVYFNNYYMIYPNFKNQSSFSTNHLGAGVHITTDGGDETHQPIDFTVPLAFNFESLLSQLPGGKLPDLKDLSAVNLLGEFQSTGSYFIEGHKNSPVHQTVMLYEKYLNCLKQISMLLPDKLQKQSAYECTESVRFHAWHGLQ